MVSLVFLLVFVYVILHSKFPLTLSLIQRQRHFFSLSLSTKRKEAVSFSLLLSLSLSPRVDSLHFITPSTWSYTPSHTYTLLRVQCSYTYMYKCVVIVFWLCRLIPDTRSRMMKRTGEEKREIVRCDILYKGNINMRLAIELVLSRNEKRRKSFVSLFFVFLACTSSREYQRYQREVSDHVFLSLSATLSCTHCVCMHSLSSLFLLCICICASSSSSVEISRIPSSPIQTDRVGWLLS